MNRSRPEPVYPRQLAKKVNPPNSTAAMQPFVNGAWTSAQVALLKAIWRLESPPPMARKAIRAIRIAKNSLSDLMRVHDTSP